MTWRYLNGHLVYVDSLLDAKFRDKNIKGGVQDVDNASLADNGSVSVGEI